MHPSRRRKKRPNYGIRTVEVMRGPNGFGFTISGQQPCILSCIVSNSPADQAGLRAGDFLISVNGISVSKITHDAVVNLIGNCISPIRMTIAENYYSDSSDEELDMARMMNTRKPKYMHKPRPYRLGKENARRAIGEGIYEGKNVNKGRDFKNCHKEPNVSGNIYMEQVQNDIPNANQNPVPMDDEAGPIEFKALVGYLGTIEMPKQLLPNNRLQTVCTCIRKLRQEKRTPTNVLMTILPTCLTLKNASNHILAIYPTNRVVYIGSATDKESRYFGLVTSAVCDARNNDTHQNNFSDSQSSEKKFNNAENDVEISNSCHVFVTDPKIVEHASHFKKAESFRINCTNDPITGTCLEFPRNALYIVNLVQTMYKLQQSNVAPSPNRIEDMNIDPLLANSPQPSASSNSDSGIGFRDDCGNISDRILVVEFPVRRVLPVINNANNNNRPVGIDALNIPLESLNLPLNNIQEQKNDNNNSPHKNNLELSIPNNLSRIDNSDKPLENSHFNNLNNIRACDSSSVKNVLDKADNKHEYLPKQNNDTETSYNGNNNNNNSNETYGRLTCRVIIDPRGAKTRCTSPLSFTSSDDNNHGINIDCKEMYNERPVDVPDPNPIKKSSENLSIRSAGDDLDFKSSNDNISMYSSKSNETNNAKCIFKMPSTNFFMVKKSVKQNLNMTSSCDNLDKYDENVMNYKLSPKVYGLSKPNYSCEELNNLDSVEKFGYSSLQDLSSWNSDKSKRNIAQSEPDVRTEKNGMCEQNGQSKVSSTEGPSTWATSFEKLLEDPVGLHMFAEFLKKEFSAENIYFWTACERYRRSPVSAERREEAQRIYERHLCMGALEPVNVDSHARQCAEQALQEGESTLFDQPQKQIFNLMKFDSYPRFLKSSLYKECLAGVIDKPELDVGLLLQPQPATPSKLKKSLSNAEDRRRKSLLPWHKKNRSKSKDRGETEYVYKLNPQQPQQQQSHCEDAGGCAKKTGQSDIHSSRSSLTSLDLAVTTQETARGSQDELSSGVGRTALCRVILSNGSTTVVQIKEFETIQQLVKRLLEKRGLVYSSFEVYTNKHSKAVDVSEASTKLAGCEVTVEQRVVFKLDLPNRKVISVKSKYTKVIVDVLRPILHKYNFNLDQVVVTKGGGELVDLAQQVSAIDNTRLNIQLRGDQNHTPNNNNNNNNPTINISNPKPNKLDEITNQVFEGILQEKAESALTKPKSDKGSVKSEDWGSEHSSGIFGKFLRRDSALHERKKKLLSSKSKGASSNGSSEDMNGEHGHMKKPLIAKWKAGVNKFQVACSESDELVEGLTRAQRQRLEDQRGTEINFELPDFLKDKDKDQNAQKPPRPPVDVENTRFYLGSSTTHSKSEQPMAVASSKNPKLELHPNNNNNNNNYENTSIIPNAINSSSYHSAQNKVTNLRIYSPNKFPISSSSNPSNSTSPPRVRIENSCGEGGNGGSPRHSEPPPLPPKPKIVPIKPPNWGHNGFHKPKDDRNKSTIFLEQPSSSFV